MRPFDAYCKISSKTLQGVPSYLYFYVCQAQQHVDSEGCTDKTQTYSLHACIYNTHGVRTPPPCLFPFWHFALALTLCSCQKRETMMPELCQNYARLIPESCQESARLKPELCQKHGRIYTRSLPEICQNYLIRKSNAESNVFQLCVKTYRKFSQPSHYQVGISRSEVILFLFFYLYIYI